MTDLLIASATCSINQGFKWGICHYSPLSKDETGCVGPAVSGSTSISWPTHEVFWQKCTRACGKTKTYVPLLSWFNKVPQQLCGNYGLNVRLKCKECVCFNTTSWEQKREHNSSHSQHNSVLPALGNRVCFVLFCLKKVLNFKMIYNLSLTSFYFRPTAR